jgi:uncharacterized protein (TIGR02265 family)
MVRTAEALELVTPHCDIADRLRYVPPSAALRGLWFHNIEREVQQAGCWAAYRSYFPDEQYSALPYYPLSDYLLRYACAGALIETPERLHHGMHRIARTQAGGFMRSLLGRTLVRLLSPDPLRLCEQGMAARRQSYRYGRWTIVSHAPNQFEVVYEDEYLWIESVVDGAARGTFETVGFDVTVETKLTSRFSGSTVMSW